MCFSLQNYAGFDNSFFTFADMKMKQQPDELKRPRKGDQCVVVLTDAEVKRNTGLGNGMDDPTWSYVGCKVKVTHVSPNFPVFICEDFHGETGVFWDIQLKVK